MSEANDISALKSFLGRESAECQVIISKMATFKRYKFPKIICKTQKPDLQKRFLICLTHRRQVQYPGEWRRFVGIHLVREEQHMRLEVINTESSENGFDMSVVRFVLHITFTHLLVGKLTSSVHKEHS